MASKISIQMAESRKPKPQADQFGFGQHFTDHMFLMDYTSDKGWHDPRIVPYQALTLEPAAQVFHYGQTVFEGLKAYRTPDDHVYLFRPEKNMERLNRSNDRMSIPAFDEELALEGLKELINLDRDWVPNAEGTSLYIRPFIISTQPTVNLNPSRRFLFIIICSPVGSYYKEGINPVKIYVERDYVRAVPGGTGTAKTGGNYAASMKAQEKALSSGFSQVLWLDGIERKYIEEVGSMNVFFKINGEVITPALNGSILHGITRNSTIELLKHLNIPITERKIAIDEIYEAHQNGTLEEAFGTGTAAVVSPVGKLYWGDHEMIINNGETGPLSKQVYETITGIQKGKLEDPFGWIVDLGN